MSCPGIEEIMAWIDGELPPDRMQAVRDHIDGCAECRKLCESQELIEKTWRESYDPPSEFQWNRFERELTGRLFRRKRNWLRTGLPIAAAFAAVLLGIRIFVIGTPPDSVLQRISHAPALPVREILPGETGTLQAGEITEDEEETESLERVDLLQTTSAEETVSDLSSGFFESALEPDESPGPLSQDDTIDGAAAASGWDAGRSTSETTTGETVAIQGSGGSAAPTEEYRGSEGGEALGMELPQSAQEPELESTEQGAFNRFFQLSTPGDPLDTATRDETGEIPESCVCESADQSVGNADGLFADGQTGAQAEEPGYLAHGYAGDVQDMDGFDDNETTVDTVKADTTTFASFGTGGMAGGGAVSSEASATGTVVVEAVTEGDAVELMTLSDDRRSRSNMDSILQMLEDDINADWSENAGPGEAMLPALITISFRIAPDGSVFDVAVAVPADSFFADFAGEIEQRVSGLTFEEVPESEYVNVEMDMVLF